MPYQFNPFTGNFDIAGIVGPQGPQGPAGTTSAATILSNGTYTAAPYGRYITEGFGGTIINDPSSPSGGTFYEVINSIGTVQFGTGGPIFGPSGVTLLRLYDGSKWETVQQTLDRNGNGPKLLNWNYALANIRNQNSKTAKILCLGDSTTAGGAGAASNGKASAWPRFLAQELSARGLTAVENGFIGTQTNVFVGSSPATIQAQLLAYEGRLSIGGDWGWTQNYAVAGAYWGGDGGGSYSSSPATFTFTPETYYDTIVIYYLNGAGSGNSTFTWSNGTSSGTLGVSSSTLNVATSKNSVTRTLAPVTITWASGSVIYIQGISLYDSTQNQIQVMNAGSAGISAYAIVNTNPTTLSNALPALGADLTIVNLGINDYGSGTDPSGFQSNLTAICNSAATTGSVLVCSWIPWINSVTNGPAYLDAMNASASACGGAFLNMALVAGYNYNDVINLGSQQSVGILNSDGVHPNYYGGKLIAQSIAKIITGN